MKTTLLMALFVISASVFAKDTILFIGGGGEPLNADETQFDGSLDGMGEFYSKNKNSYNAIVNFNGGHYKTEKKIAKYFAQNEVVNNFTAPNYDRIIDDTIKKLSSNPPQIPAGGKILIFINSHGSEKINEQTHSISTAKSAMTSMNAGGSGMVSLDKLKQLSDLAEKKNVRLGIVDGSCHAGNSLALANSKTCVVAASGPNHYSYSDFAEIYSKNMSAGKTLEEVFHETSDAVEGKGFPMISTPAGVSAQNEMYPYLTPYMYYHDEYRGLALDKIDNYMREVNTPELMCRRNADYIKLEALVKLIENVGRVTKASGNLPSAVDLSGLKKQLADYKKTQDEYFNKLSKLNLTSLDKKEIIETNYYKGSNNGFTHKELMSTNFEFLIKNKQEVFESRLSNDKKKEQALNMIEYYRAALAARDRIMRENPDYTQQEAIISRLKNDNDVSFKVAAKIMKEAHEAYNAYYKIKESELLKLGKRPPNPCKDFVL